MKTNTNHDKPAATKPHSARPQAILSSPNPSILALKSRHSLDGALAAAWHAGRLLNKEKKRVRHSAGHGVWLPWLEHFFTGSTSTAHRYMRLARSTSDLALLQGLSLRQAYTRLGVATKPKRPVGQPPLPKPPAHVLLAGKLIRFLRQQKR